MSSLCQRRQNLHIGRYISHSFPVDCSLILILGRSKEVHPTGQSTATGVRCQLTDIQPQIALPPWCTSEEEKESFIVNRVQMLEMMYAKTCFESHSQDSSSHAIMSTSTDGSAAPLNIGPQSRQRANALHLSKQLYAFCSSLQSEGNADIKYLSQVRFNKTLELKSLLFTVCSGFIRFFL